MNALMLQNNPAWAQHFVEQVGKSQSLEILPKDLENSPQGAMAQAKAKPTGKN